MPTEAATEQSAATSKAFFKSDHVGVLSALRTLGRLTVT